MGIPDLEKTIAKLEEKISEVKEATREANETLKTIRLEKKEVIQLKASIESEVAKQVGEIVTPFIVKEMESMGEELKKTMDLFRDHTQKQVDQWVNLCVYGNKQGRGENVFDLLRRRAEGGHEFLDGR